MRTAVDFRKKWQPGLCLGLLVLTLVTGVACQNTSTVLPTGSRDLVQPAELVKVLASGGAKPALFYVGPRFLFAQARIRGSEFIGPTGTAAGLDSLRKRVASMPKNAAIVIFCGCCPWDHCPNVKPAFEELQKLGFTNVKVLYLPNNLGADWVEKGYPFDRG